MQSFRPCQASRVRGGETERLAGSAGVPGDEDRPSGRRHAVRMEAKAAVETDDDELRFLVLLLETDINDPPGQDHAEGAFEDEGPRDIQEQGHARVDHEAGLETERYLLGADAADGGPLLEFPARRVQALDQGRKRELEGALP